jgi:hypothetical protein
MKNCDPVLNNRAHLDSRRAANKSNRKPPPDKWHRNFRATLLWSREVPLPPSVQAGAAAALEAAASESFSLAASSAPWSTAAPKALECM